MIIALHTFFLLYVLLPAAITGLVCLVWLLGYWTGQRDEARREVKRLLRRIQ